MHIDVFTVNPTSMRACKGVPIRLELKGPRVTPYVAAARHNSPEERQVIMAEDGKTPEERICSEIYL